MKRKIISLLLVSAAVFGLTSCFAKETEPLYTFTSYNTSETEPPETVFPLEGHVSSSGFSGRGYNIAQNEYLDVNQVIYTVTFTGGVDQYNWIYGYYATLDGEEIVREEGLELNRTSSVELVVDLEDGSSGHFVIAFCDEKGEEIVSGECEIDRTSPASFSDINNFSVTPGNPVTLPGTRIDVTIPAAFTDYGDPGNISTGQYMDVGEVLAYYVNDNREYFMIEYIDNEPWDYVNHANSVDRTFEVVTDTLARNRASYTGPLTSEYTLNGTTYPVTYLYTEPAEYVDNASIFYAMMIVGDRDTSYALSMYLKIPEGEVLDPDECLEQFLSYITETEK